MTFDPERHHRRSIRLKAYDYRNAGAYFVTVVSQERPCLFGGVADLVMRLNDTGRMVQQIWRGLPRHYPGVEVDAFVVMPNHVHGIIVVTNGVATRVGAGPVAALMHSQRCLVMKLDQDSDFGRWHRATTGGCPYELGDWGG